MEVQPLTFEIILDALRKQATTDQNPLILDARIIITPQDAQLLDIQPPRPMEIIRY